jgi:hypothetical protein
MTGHKPLLGGDSPVWDLAAHVHAAAVSASVSVAG